MTFEELTKNKSDEEIDKITYFDLLKCDEWKQKRLIILKRDNYKCTKCKKTYTIKTYSGNNIIHLFADAELNPENVQINLQVHHTFYIYNKLPWEYDNEILETLCNICHEKLHNCENVYIIDQNTYNKYKFGLCDRCSGKGYIKEFRKIQGGICFKCRGYGYDKPIINIKEIIKL